MKHIFLKCEPNAFNATRDGRKTFEFRVNDRDYQVDDFLYLFKWIAEKEVLTGEVIKVRVNYILKNSFNIPNDMCIMSISLCF